VIAVVPVLRYFAIPLTQGSGDNVNNHEAEGRRPHPRTKLQVSGQLRPISVPLFLRAISSP
jgi:hypothetical protein